MSKSTLKNRFFFFFFFPVTSYLFRETHTNYLHCYYSTYNTTLNTYSTYNTMLNTYSTYNTTLNTYSTYNTTRFFSKRVKTKQSSVNLF